MGVYTFTAIDETSPIAPARLFKALCLDNHIIFPKVLPHVIKTIDFVEGDSTVVGCVKQYNFAEGIPHKYAKGKVNELDVNNCYVKFTNIEGDILGDVLECIVYEVKMETSGSGSHYKMVCHFHTKGDIVVTETDDIVKGDIQSLVMTYKAVQEYLLNNPQLCA
ncbi:pathogenesis-related protein STH-21-like [Amaranthus tricolor]|uniref:pathogenesis-related protein STH-21-like n=1 Tax=Amaranthus tricolor TaxID=29722 RepID=UPI00258EEBDE|nr:pathogenesis-related protein STH-21-like [Amaranthus tricolor]